jgi:ABC-type iron transport system FetAB permease component
MISAFGFNSDSLLVTVISTWNRSNVPRSTWLTAHRTRRVQVTVAGYTAGQRAKQVPRGKYIACVSILVGTAITMFLLVVLNVFPFTPRYIIPVAGMMVGNAMTVTGVTMKKLREDVKIQRNLVSSQLRLYLDPSPQLFAA